MATEQAAAADTAAPDAAEANYRAGLAALMKGEDPPTEEEPKKDKPATDEKPAEGDEDKPAESEPEEKPEDEEEPEGDEEDTDEDEEKPEEDEGKAKYSKALRKLQKEEERIQSIKSEVLAKERDIAGREQQLRKEVAELGDFIKKLQLDPFNTLLKSGLLNEDDAEYISKQLYFNSKAAAADPKNKAEAERIRRERERELEVRRTRQEVEQLKQEREAERQQAAKDAALNAYVGKIDAAVENYKAKTPVLAKALEKNPTRTRQELFQIANDLSVAKGEFADPTLVVLAWTKQRKALLAELGVAEPSGTAAPNKAKSKSAAESKGTPEKQKKDAAAQSEAEREAAYQKELRARLAGEYVGD